MPNESVPLEDAIQRLMDDAHVNRMAIVVLAKALTSGRQVNSQSLADVLRDIVKSQDPDGQMTDTLENLAIMIETDHSVPTTAIKLIVDNDTPDVI